VLQQSILHNEYPEDFVAYQLVATLGLARITIDSSLKLYLKDCLLRADNRPSSFRTALK